MAETLEKANHYILGCQDLVVTTNHLPILKIISDRKMEDIPNTRLLNLKEKTLRFRFDIITSKARSTWPQIMDVQITKFQIISNQIKSLYTQLKFKSTELSVMKFNSNQIKSIYSTKVSIQIK